MGLKSKYIMIIIFLNEMLKDVFHTHILYVIIATKL